METVEQLVSFHHIQVQLSGGAPWGFTLKGGLEHGEPLIITKIEEGGKVAQCKKLKVGDELININGSALYGSRQEALILIKGSYRILKLAVRRRSLPIIRPHSWQLAKVSELPLPPPPPSPPLCVPPPADYPALPPPPPPPAMQLHPGAYTLAWHTSDNSDLTMQWGQLSRPYSSTDRSSSLGSMESLDTATPVTQPFSDSLSSPVDPALFNNKRDSAYSSFSASSNTSDYATVPLRPVDVYSMDNFFQSLGPPCFAFPGRDAAMLGSSSGEAPNGAQLIGLKSRSLTRPRPRPVEVKERPSSFSYEEETRGVECDIIRNGEDGSEIKMTHTQSPNRNDSFKTTRTCLNLPNKRCASAPIEMCTVPCFFNDNTSSPNDRPGIHNGFLQEEEGNTKHDSQNEQRSSKMSAQKDYSDKTTTDHFCDPVGLSLVSSEPSGEAQGLSHVMRSQTKHTCTGLNQQNDPKNVPQLQFEQFNSDNSSRELSSQSDPPCSTKWSCVPPCLMKDQQPSNSHSLDPPNKTDGSRCSTPGSVFLELEMENGMGVRGKSLLLVQHHLPWGRSVSVPEETTEPSVQGILGSNQLLVQDFQPLSVAASVDTLMEERSADESRGVGEKSEENAAVEATMKKSSKYHRRNCRRSERFATNLRNEIQKKKAQLQSSRGPGGLLSSGETVQEEEGTDLHEEPEEADFVVKERSTKVVFASTASPLDTVLYDKPNTSCQTNCDDPTAQPPSTMTAIQIVDPQVPNFGVGVRVVEEPAPAGKARRWRWTPEHKLQPEPKPNRLHGVVGDGMLGVTQSRHGACAFTSSSNPSGGRSSSCSRLEDSDILPFSDRRKFFEETSKSIAGSKVSSLSGHSQRKSQDVEHVQCTNQRRYSYQEGLQQEKTLLPNPMEAGRPSVCNSREKPQEKERDQMRTWKERSREQERDGMLQEMEMQQEKERQERELELERERLWEKEREERVRRWDREREMELELERAKEKERLKKEREEELQRERKELFSSSYDRERDHDIHDQNPQHKSHSISQVSRSAFYPVNQLSQPCLHRRSYTPTEAQYPARQQETSKLNRKYSLTERDYSSWRREQHQEAPHQGSWYPGQLDSGRDSCNGHTVAPLSHRGRAMSENDLRFNQHWTVYSPTVGQTLREVEERPAVFRGDTVRGAQLTSRKKNPPPRPPPPKWEQFHRRRASHHMLFCSSSTAPPQHPSTEPTEHLSVESSRQRSYSLPPQRQEVAENCLRCSRHQPLPCEPAFPHTSSSQHQFSERSFSTAPPSPMFCRQAFRPVVLSPQERGGNLYFQQHETVTAPTEILCLDDLSQSDTSQSDLHKPLANLRPEAGWDTTPCPRIPSHNACSLILKDGHLGGVLPSSASFVLDYKQQQHNLDLPRPTETGTESVTTLSPSPSHSLEAELDVPLETDIDDFQEDEGLPAEDELITSELSCFALPVTVMETDIDTLTDIPTEPVGEARREEIGSLEEELESGREGLSLEELLIQGSEGESGTERWRGAFLNAQHNTDSLDRRSGASSSCSSYYSTSAAKAQLLSQMKDFNDNKEHEEEELTYKRQLMESLRKKLGVLREAQRGLQDDIRANAQLGEEVESMAVAACKANEVDKFRMFIGDLDKVVSLLLSLSARLLRVETTLDTLDPDTEEDERLPLLEKKRQLMRQLSEAQDLKDHVDRREQAVSRALARCLSPDQHRDYSHFVKMKAALLVEQKQLEDKIRLGEEQLRGLRESLGLGLGLGMGMSMGYGQY
ncbi:protein Shroom4 isoform X2 [Nerophis ophidion]|uniref:protein Shroom4 isoform X2 n=1 Tax=Nerophis ophidion TaxID=159077 RepID=UPI002AE0409E|nr:protein Shroom4 isoform X2 [Nerophis ophidion]